VRVSFTATPTDAATYTISIAGTVTDRADPPNRFEGIAAGATHTETIVYAADTTAPTVASAALTAADEITVTFSEPVSGTMSTGDWAVYRAEPNFLTSASVLTENTRISTLQAVSAPGHARAASVTIPAASPVTQASVHFLSQPTDAGMFVGYRGSSLQDRASNALATHPQATNSVATTDMAGPEPFRVYVNPVPPRQRQADSGDILNFPVGNSLIVRPGDMVRFTVVWSATDFTQDPSLTTAQYRERLTGTTVSYFGGEPVAMERTGDEATAHTLTVPEGAPEGPFRPTFTASDDHGNVRSSTSAFKEGYCDTSLAATAEIRQQGNQCAYNPTFPFDGQDLGRLDRIYPTVDSTPPSPVSARALSPTETLVTFGEPVRHLGGTQAQRAAHWSVSHGSAPTAAAVSGAADGGQSPRAGDPGDYLVTLTHAPVPAGAERTVSYSRGDAAARIVDRVGHEAAMFGPLDVAVGAYTSVAVLDGGSDARGGAYARYANLNDRITVTAVFMHDVPQSGAGVPTITVNSDSGSTATEMTVDPDNAMRWTHSFTVAAGDDEGALDFEIEASDTMSPPNTATYEEDTVQNGNAIIDLTAPAAVSASFASLAPPGIVNVEFSEDIMVPAGGWSLRAAVAGAPGLPVTAASREPGMMDTARLTTTRATPGVPYTVGVPAALADLAGNAYDASAPGPVATYPVKVVTATVEDGPSFTARTGENARYANEGDRITVYVEFSEGVAGAPRITVASDDGSSATDMGDAGDTNDRTWSHQFTVASGDMEGGLDFDIAAEVTSGVPGSVTVTEASVRGNAIIDLTSPTVSSASFAGATTVEVEFGEPVVVPSAGWAVRTIPSGSGDLAVSPAMPKEGEPETAVLTVAEATDMTAYRITVPAALTDLAGNAYDTTVTHDATYTAPAGPTFTAVTSRVGPQDNRIIIGFSEAVTGTTRAGEWLVDGTATTIIYRHCLPVGPPSQAIDVTSICAMDATVDTILLHAPAGSAATPRVEYVAPTGAGATPIVTAAGSVPIERGPVTATDGRPPLFSAATAGPNTVAVTFDEPAMAVGAGAPDASRWHHYDSTAIPPSTAELAAAVTAMADFDSASLSADGLTLTLGLSAARAADSASRWDSDDTGSTPVTIGYDIPSGGSADIADTRGNGLAQNTAVRPVADGAPPAFSAATSAADTVVVTFSEAVSLAGGAAAPDASRWHHYESSATPPGAEELAAAAAAMKSFDSASLSADGMTLMLGLTSPHAADAASMWDSADPGDTPGTIGYSIPSGMASDLADAAGNALADNTADATVTDGAPPAPTGAITGTREVTLTFLEPPTRAPNNGGHFFYGVFAASDMSRSMNLTQPLPAPMPGEPSGASALMYTPETSTAPATLVIPTREDVGPNALVVRIGLQGTATLTDGANALPENHEVPVPPAGLLFTAETASQASITVSFATDVSLAGSTTALAASSWIVDPDGRDGATNSATDDIAVTSATFADAANTVTLALDASSANIGDTSKAPYVEYTGAGELESAAGLPLRAGASATAADGAPPEPAGAVTGPSEITVTFPEAPDMDPTRTGITWTVTTAADTATPLAQAASSPAWAAATSTEPAAVTLTVTADLASVAHTVTIASSATATIEDAEGNALAFSLAVPVAAPVAPTFTAETVRIDSTDYIRIEFSAAVTGMTRAGEWFIGVDATDGTGGAAVSVISRVCATSPLPTSVINVAQVCSGDMVGRPVYLGYSAADTAARPTVAYRAPSGMSATPIASAAAGLALGGGPVTATDGLAPAFTAATSAANEVVVTFSEAVSLAGGAASPDASRWHHYESSATPPSAMELAAAVTAMKNFDTASLSADGMTLTLGLTSPHEADAASMWDSANPGDTPDTIGYGVPSGMASDLADAAGNGLADNTADATVTDGAPPAPEGSATGLREITLTFREAPTASPQSINYVYHAYPGTGATSAMNLTASGSAASVTTYVPATATAPARLLIPTNADLGDVAHTVRIDSRNNGQLQDGDANRLAFPHHARVPATVLFSASVTSLAEIVVSFNADVALAGSTTALAAANWMAVAVDNTPPQAVSARTGSVGSVGEDAADPADNVYADHIDVTFSEPVSFEDGSTAAQRAARWTVADDEASPQAIAVDDAALVLAMPADTSSRVVRLSLDATRSPHALSGSAATPEVSYSAAGATAGRLVLPGTTDPVADAAGIEAADGIGPRLESIPVRGDLTPSTPADDDGAAIVLTFSEDLDPATVGRSGMTSPPGMVREGMGVAARLQIDASSPTGFKVPLLDDRACSPGLNWSPATYTVAVDADGNTDLADIVPTADGMGLQRGTQANTIRVASPTSSSDMSQRIFWFCLTPPSSDYDNWLANSAVRDTAGNPYVAVEAPPHGQHVAAADSRAPEFTATVTSATEISVFYDEPVRLKAGASIDASEWRVDTTPNDATDNADGATWLTPSSASHSFGPMLRPEYYAYGHPDHLEPTDARLGIVLTFAGAMFDPDQGLNMDGTDPRPRVHYASSGATVDVEDVYGNDAASPASVQSRDSIPPGVTSLVVEVSTASTEGAPVPNKQYARASASSPVAVTFTVTFDEAPDPMQAPILGILADVTESTTVAATSGARDEARVWHMTETAADDGHTWEYTWTVTNMLPGESTPRGWGSGFGLFYGILVQDSDGNALVYTQDGRYPDGSRPQVTLDSAAPAAVSVEMRGRPAGSDAAFTSTVGRPGSEVELHFTVGERDDRLVHAESGSGDATMYAPGLEASAVTFFSGADTTQATSLAGPEVISGVSHYRARATIPAGHADGPIEWAISILDIYGWSASTDSGDVGMTGHPASLGFNVDGTAPEIVAASSHAGVDTTGGTRAATDALATSAGAGATVLVDITFNEAIGGTPEVRGTGTRLVLAEDGTGERVDHEFHAAAAMTAVAGSGNTRWQHSWTVPAASSVEHHDSTYRVELLMPMDEAGNTQMTCAGCPGLNDVQVDNVAPSMTGLSFIHGADDAGGRPIPWAAIEYTDHGGLRADGLRAYLNTTSADAALAGAGHLLVKAGDISLSNPGTGAACVAAAATCTTHEGSTVDSRQGLFFRFDYGAGTASATALTDRAGNAASWDQPDPGPHPTSGERFTDPSGFRDASARFANADDPLPVVGRVAPASLDLGPLGLGPAGEALLFDVAYSPPEAAGASLTLAAGTDAGGLAPASPALALAALPAALAPEYYATIMPADAGGDGAAQASLASMGAAAAVDAGRLESPASPVLLSHPARVTLPGVPGAAAAHVFWISNSHTAAASDDRVHSVPECSRRSTAAAADAGDVAPRAQPDQLDPSTYAAADNAECFVRDARADAIHVWTNHFTPFGASAEMRTAAASPSRWTTSPAR